MIATQRDLLPNEKVLYQARLHWMTFANSVMWTLVAVLVVFAFPYIAIFGYVALVFAVVTWLVALATFISADFVVTNRRVLMSMGIVRRISFDMSLEKIESIQVRQKIFGKLLTFGTVIINGIGGSKDIFPKIDNPLLFRKQIYQQIDAIKQANKHG